MSISQQLQFITDNTPGGITEEHREWLQSDPRRISREVEEIEYQQTRRRSAFCTYGSGRQVTDLPSVEDMWKAREARRQREERTQSWG